MDLGNVFAGKAGRRGNEQDETVIDDRPITITQRTISRFARLRHRPGNRFDNESDAIAGYPNHGDASTPGTRGQRHNRRMGFHRLLPPEPEFRR